MLISGSVSGSTLPVRQVITREKVPFVSSISSNINLMKPFSRYIFRIYANEDSQALGIIDWMMDHEKITRPAIIYNSNDYGVGGFQMFPELSEKEIQDLTVPRPNAIIRAIRTSRPNSFASRPRIPDGLLIYAFAQEAGIIVRQAKELGITAKLFGGGGDIDPAAAARRRASGDRLHFHAGCSRPRRIFG